MTEVARKAPADVPAKRKRRPVGHPKGLRFHVRASEQITAISTKLGLNGEILTFRDVAAAVSQRSGVKVSLGTIHRYSKGIEPDDADLRRALKLPASVRLKACPKCGQIHIRKTCADTRPRDYDAWKAANLDKLNAIVAWAETPPGKRKPWRR